jgi:ABC-2 type transport system permease protein
VSPEPSIVVARKNPLTTYISELWATRELLVNLTMRDVKGKYRRTIFGQLWSLINPLATMLVYTIVFAVLFRTQPPPGNPSGLNSYPLWLVCGLLPWTFFNHTVTTCMTSIVDGASLIKKVYFPRIHLPLAEVGAEGFTWMNEMALIVVIIGFLTAGKSLPWVPLMVVFMVLLAMFASGIGMMLAVVNVHFRDMQHFVTIALRLGLYLTPIMYPLTIVEKLAEKKGAWVLNVFELNPMAHFTDVFRNLLYDNRWPNPVDVIWCVACGFVVFAVGSVVFVRNEKKFGRLL